MTELDPVEEQVVSEAADSQETVPTVAEVWASVLGLESVDPDVPLDALGGNSIDALFIISRVRDDLGVTVTATDLLRYPTLALFDALVQERRRGIAERQ